MKLTYKELINKEKKLKTKITELEEELSSCDNSYELSRLINELGEYETQLIVIEDYIDRIIDKGRN